MQETILDKQHAEPGNKRRRDLLPLWIKFFVWLFLIFSLIVPFSLALGAIGVTLELALYGLETIYPFSIIGLFIIFLFALKGVVGFGLWTEKKWAVRFAIVDGIIGIITCLCIMFVLPRITDLFVYGIYFEYSKSYRLELLFLIAYLWKMVKIKKEWETTH